ncbi:hypothetical protein ABBQ32_012575 [Trebouxia sp. C0010 RCD-2024]
MRQGLYYAVALLAAEQRLFRRPLHSHRKASDASRAASGATGRARDQHNVFCCSPQQHAKLSCYSHLSQPAQGQEEGPDISSLDPALQLQWDHAGNAHLGNIVIKPQSKKKVWWTCDQCPDGHLHSWSAMVQSRHNGTGCPQCSSRVVCKHNSLATKAPLVAAEWDYQANDHTPEDLVAHSHHKANWHCKLCGCKWEAAINARVGKIKTGCPQCFEASRTMARIRHPTFAECSHPLLAEWDHQRNAAQGHFPDKVTLKSNKQIFWICTNCPAGQEHSWSARPTSRTGHIKSGCPFCAGQAACKCNSLKALYPDTAAEWDYKKNQSQPSNYTASSTHLAWWFNPQYGSWQQSVDARTIQVQKKAARLRRSQERQNSARPSLDR